MKRKSKTGHPNVHKFPRGQITAGMAIIDTMNYISCDVSTTCVGMAASMGAVLLSAGKKGKRFALPHSEILIHQPLTPGIEGQASDIAIHAEHMLKQKQRLYEILSKASGQSVKR